MLAYLDTNSGIAGDMTLAALVDAGADVEYLVRQIRSLGLPQVQLRFSPTQRHCFRALRLDIEHPIEHAHRGLSDIERMFADSQLSPRERDMSQRVFRRIGAAEAKVHGMSLEEVHFHEVGAIDSIVDIVGVAVALCQLDIDRIVAAPPPVGSGSIQIAHGQVSIPAPATAELLRGIPLRSSEIQAELTTPTGAAILAALVDGFGPVPDMQISRIGYGAGHKELREQANLLRVLIGVSQADYRDQVTLLETNLDDVTGEQLGYAVEKLWQTGALDVYTTAIGMKKNRPGVLLSVLCRPEQRVGLEDCIFEHTGSLGIRRSDCLRRKLHREVHTVETPLGTARVKLAWMPVGSIPSTDDLVEDLSSRPSNVHIAPEFEDCRRLAQASGQSLPSVYRIVHDAAAKWQHDATISPPPASVPDPAHHHPHDHDHHHDHHH